MIAPVLATLDNLDSYLDPALTPEDFLEWLAGWVGLLPDETWPIERRRALVARCRQTLSQPRHGGWAGNARSLLTAGEVEVVDSGGSVWSATAGAAAPGDGSYSVTVKVKPPKKGGVGPGADRGAGRRGQAGTRNAPGGDRASGLVVSEPLLNVHRSVSAR